MNFIVDLDEDYVIMIYINTNQKEKTYVFKIIAILDNDMLLIEHIQSIMQDYVFLKREDGYVVADNYETIYLHKIILEYYAQFNCKLFTLLNSDYQINHKNSNINCNKNKQLFNKSDNRLCNLEIVTADNNKAHFYANDYEVAMTSLELIAIRDETINTKNTKYSKLVKKYKNCSEHNTKKCLNNKCYDEKFFNCMYVNFKNLKYKLSVNEENSNIIKIFNNLELKIFNKFIEQFIINNSNNTIYENNERLYNFIIYKYFNELIFQYNKNRTYRLLFNNLVSILNKYDSKEDYKNVLNKYYLLDNSINQDKYIYIEDSYNIIKKYLYELKFLSNNKLDTSCISNKLDNLKSEIYIDKKNNKLLNLDKKVLIDLFSNIAIYIMKNITINITDKLIIDASAEKLMILDLENHIILNLKTHKIIDFNNKFVLELNKANLEKYDFYNKFLKYIRNYTDAEFLNKNMIIELYNYIIARHNICNFNKNNLLCNIVVNCMFPKNRKYQPFFSLYDIEMLSRNSVKYDEKSNSVSSFVVPHYTADYMNSKVLVESKKLYKQDLTSIKRIAISQNEGEDKLNTVYKNKSVEKRKKFDDILVEDIETAISTTLLQELEERGYLTFDCIQEELEAYRCKSFKEYSEQKENLEHEGRYDEAENLEYRYDKMRDVNKNDISYALQNVTSLKKLLKKLKLEVTHVSNSRKEKIIDYEKKRKLKILWAKKLDSRKKIVTFKKFAK